MFCTDSVGDASAQNWKLVQTSLILLNREIKISQCLIV